MIEINVMQGTQDWYNLRLGIPTASQFHRIITPVGLKPSSAAAKYACEKVAERILGFPMEFVQSGAMVRGSAMEESAAAWYEFHREVETRTSGIFLNDDRNVGASVDRLVGDDGILEIKCPLAPNHIANLLGVNDGAEHFLQCQGQMWITGRKWCDLLSFFPELPPSLIRVERDEKAIEALASEVDRFCVRLDFAERRVRESMGLEHVA